MQEPKQTAHASCRCGKPVPGLGEERFTAAITPHLAALVRMACKLLGSEDLAWDAVQETLVSLWQEASWPLHLHTWLRRTLWHRCLHTLRTRWRRGQYEGRAAASRPTWSQREDPSYVLENQELQSLAQQVLAELAEEQRTILALRELEQLDYAAIAATLHIPVGTVRSRLHRSRVALREILCRRRYWT